MLKVIRYCAHVVSEFPRCGTQRLQLFSPLPLEGRSPCYPLRSAVSGCAESPSNEGTPGTDRERNLFYPDVVDFGGLRKPLILKRLGGLTPAAFGEPGLFDPFEGQNTGRNNEIIFFGNFDRPRPSRAGNCFRPPAPSLGLGPTLAASSLSRPKPRLTARLRR